MGCTMKRTTIFAVILILSAILMTSCSSYYSKYGFTGVYIGSMVKASLSEPTTTDNSTFLDKLCFYEEYNFRDDFRQFVDEERAGTQKTFNILGVQFTESYLYTYKRTLEIMPRHSYGIREIEISIEPDGTIKYLSILNDANEKLDSKNKDCYILTALEYAKEYIKQINPNIDLKQYELQDYSQQRNKSRFKFAWRKYLSGILSEVLTIQTDRKGNLRLFTHSGNMSANSPELKEEECIGLIEKKLHSFCDDIDFEQNVTFKDIELVSFYSAASDELLLVIYAESLNSYAIRTKAKFTVEYEDGTEEYLCGEFYFTYNLDEHTE